MRKCVSCGYLLLGDGDACAKCGAPLLAANAVGAPAPPAARAPSAAAPPPPPPSAWGAPAAPPGAAPTAPLAPAFGRLSLPPPPPNAPEAPVPALREMWQPVAMPAPASPPHSKRLGLIALGVAMALALVLGAGALHLGSESLPAGTHDFVAGKGVVFTSPDGVYRARFPQAPTMESVPSPGNGVILNRAYVKSDSYEVQAASSIAPAPVPAASANVFLEAGLAGEVANLKGKLQSKTETTFAGMPAIEGSFKGSDGYAARILVVASGANLFEVVVHSKTGADKLFTAFEASLTIY